MPGLMVLVGRWLHDQGRNTHARATGRLVKMPKRHEAKPDMAAVPVINSR
jgi:hypothetical protein